VSLYVKTGSYRGFYQTILKCIILNRKIKLLIDSLHNGIVRKYLGNNMVEVCLVTDVQKTIEFDFFNKPPLFVIIIKALNSDPDYAL